MKTSQEIAHEMERLEEQRRGAPLECQRAIDAQIQVLADVLSFDPASPESDISLEYGDDEFVEEMALYAFYWANGEEDIPPSDEWAYSD